MAAKKKDGDAERRKIEVESPEAEAVETGEATAEDGSIAEAEAVEGGEDAPAPEPVDPLEAMTAERDEFKDRWLRAVAEQENLRKRTRREVSDAHTFSRVEIVRGLLEVLDNFERAQEARPQDAEAHVEFKGFLDGVQLVHDRLRSILEGYGLKPIAAEKGEDFDPNQHEAVAQIEDPEVESGAIVAVAQSGYRLGDVVLRPTRVMVAK